MAYAPIQAYVKAALGSLPGSDKIYLENELKKLQKTLQDIIAVIAQIQSKVTYP